MKEVIEGEGSVERGTCEGGEGEGRGISGRRMKGMEGRRTRGMREKMTEGGER